MKPVTVNGYCVNLECSFMSLALLISKPVKHLVISVCLKDVQCEF